MVNLRAVAAPAPTNVHVIEAELGWLEAVMAARFADYGAGDGSGILLPVAPPLDHRRGAYASLVKELALDPVGRLVLVLALAPYVAPAQLDLFFLQNAAIGRRFTEFGGVTGRSHPGFLPTAETARFLLALPGLHDEAMIDPAFLLDHPLVRRGIVTIDRSHPEEPPLAGVLRLSPYGLHRLLHGNDFAPRPGLDFPATEIDTPLDWKDLVVDAPTRRQIDMVGLWIEHSATLMENWGLSRRLKPGYRCLFYGPPGTGKTLTTCLLGKRFKRTVYRVDLSRVVSKWIGETEKNLATLFDQAANRDWILFFDEADALFGKRAESQSANDRAANQQIAYLLQRLESHPGIAILATNQNDHLDEAFARRFQSTIYFPMPDAAARLRLWRETFASHGFTVARDVDFKALAARYELAGGAMINVLRHSALMAVQRHPAVVEQADIIDGIRLEMQKDGRYLT